MKHEHEAPPVDDGEQLLPLLLLVMMTISQNLRRLPPHGTVQTFVWLITPKQPVPNVPGRRLQAL